MREIWIMAGGSSAVRKLNVSPKIVVNNDFKRYPDAEYFVTCDYRFSDINREGLEKFKGTKVLVVQTGLDYIKCGKSIVDTRFAMSYDLSHIDVLIKSNKYEGWGDTMKDFGTGLNSGFCAVQFAICLGYDLIHLVGFDLCFREKQTHWHDWNRHNYKDMEKYLGKFLPFFERAIVGLRFKDRVKLISHSPISMLNRWIPYEEVPNA